MARWQRRGLFGVFGLLLVSGGAWLAVHWTVGAGAGELPHPFEAWALRLHALLGSGALFLLGVMAGAHVPRGWRMSGRPRWAHQRGFGLALLVLGALLVLSAYALGYLVPEAWHAALGWGHAAAGVLMCGVLAVHARRAARPPR